MASASPHAGVAGSQPIRAHGPSRPSWLLASAFASAGTRVDPHLRTSGSASLRRVRIGPLEASLRLALELTECQLVSKVVVLALST